MDTMLDEALKYALLTNTVPFKPPGNKAYSEPVKERFRPFLERLLTLHWKGRHVITLGTEAFQWFQPYGDPEAFRSVGKTDARFEVEFPCHLPIHPEAAAQPAFKAVVVRPLPHPSPLNQRWYSQFPTMLARRLAEVQNQLAS
jgi:uracil-DNA glycosylase